MRRTLQFKFTMPSAEPRQLYSMMTAMKPFYEMFGVVQVRLLQNVDDPAKYIQIIEYDAPESMEVNRQKIASDPRVQTYLQAWRQFIPNAIEIDVYRDAAT